MIILPRKQENKVFLNLKLSKKYFCENIFAKFMQSDNTHIQARHLAASESRPLLWQYGWWSFQTGYTNLERFLPKNQHAKRIFWILRIGLMGRCQKVQNHPTSRLSKSIFYIKNYPNLSQFFFNWRISIQEDIFCCWHFFITLIFKSLYFLKWCPIFDSSPLL